jgi:hypothetical protein
VLTLRLVFHLRLRLLDLALTVSDHSTLSRRDRAFAGR